MFVEKEIKEQTVISVENSEEKIIGIFKYHSGLCKKRRDI